MQKIPRQLGRLFFKIRQDVPGMLGNNLVGIYLYGSLTYNAFNQLKSDVDCAVVIKRNLDDNEVKSLSRWYKQISKVNPWVKRLEMTYTTKQDVSKRLGQKLESLVYHNSRLRKIDWSDGANPITWFNIYQRGSILYGLNPKVFVPKVSRQLLRKALRTELRYLKDRRPQFARAPWDQAYAVLTLCRILYTLKSNIITSKEKAAKWCIKVVPEWEKLVNLSLEYRYSNSKKPNSSLQKLTPGFLNFVQSKF